MKIIKQIVKKIYRTFPLVIKDISKKDLWVQSAALSYYCALSLAPFVLLTLTIFSLFGPETQDAFGQQIQQVMGKQAAQAVLLIIQTSKEKETTVGISSVLGILALIISASAVFTQLKTTIVAIFSDEETCDVEVTKGSWLSFLKEKVFSIGMMVSFIFISLISLMLSSALPLILSANEETIWQVFNFVISFALYLFVFYLVFYYVSDKKVKKKYALTGGVIAAALFLVGRSIISTYLSKSAAGSSYGAAGSLIVLLIWVYYSSFTIFISGIITKNLDQNSEIV